ncbi:PEP-CTERM sorting domain-containing protein [Aliiglaciecola litoralis]|uniref:Ice-binding protein C-terminal domain-containing protein n=1 Tax=Aliiglaciecola litoralis TaxID=582857 RepID=A0ABP3WWW4_9ALTE
MKYLKNVLLATGLMASTLGMSMSANAGAIIQQEIYADINEDFGFFGVSAGLDQLLGTITYNTDLADEFGFLDTDSTVVDINFGFLNLTMADSDSVFFGMPIVAGFDPFNFTAGLEFYSEGFVHPSALELFIDVGPLSSGSVIAEDTFDGIFSEGNGRLGQVTYVPEPSALVLMLAGLGLLVRRKVAAK